MKYNSFLLFLFCSVLVGCDDWPPSSGPTEYMQADTYQVNCEYTYTPRGTIDTETGYGTINVCSVGQPMPSSKYAACQVFVGTLRDDNGFRLFNAQVTDSSSTFLSRDSCPIVRGTSTGVGVVINPLVNSSGVQPEFELLNDNTGRITGESSLSTIEGNVSESNIRISAKFRKWRSANTTAQGKIQMDGGDCRNNSCPIILRYLSFNISDFTIVRPTIFARDVHISNARVKVLNNYEGILNQNGQFEFNGLKVIVTGTYRGQQFTFLFDDSVTLKGRFEDYIAGSRVASKRIKLRINMRTDTFTVDASALFSRTKSQARLQNISTGRCLRGMVTREREERASIESCSNRTKPQNWVLQSRGTQFQIMQPITNTCLNLKQSSQNREGGKVGIVGCSSHADQLWKIYSNGKIVHPATGKCLNVHRGRENRNGGLVSVYSCAETRDQRWRLISIK